MNILRVVSFNINCFRNASRNTQIEHILKLDPDIICIQECDCRFSFDEQIDEKIYFYDNNCDDVPETNGKYFNFHDGNINQIADVKNDCKLQKLPIDFILFDDQTNTKIRYEDEFNFFCRYNANNEHKYFEINKRWSHQGFSKLFIKSCHKDLCDSITIIDSTHKGMCGVLIEKIKSLIFCCHLKPSKSNHEYRKFFWENFNDEIIRKYPSYNIIICGDTNMIENENYNPKSIGMITS